MRPGGLPYQRVRYAAVRVVGDLSGHACVSFSSRRFRDCESNSEKERSKTVYYAIARIVIGGSSMRYTAWIVNTLGGPFQRIERESKPLADNEVLVKISAS